MKQSERMRLFLQYRNHPLRKEYEEKKKQILSKHKCFQYYLITIIQVLSCVMIPGWLVVLCVLDFEFSFPIILGIINLVCAFFSLLYGGENKEWYQEQRNEKELIELKTNFKEKGCVEAEDPYTKECGEYNNYDVFVCSATQQPLTFEEKQWCQTKGNCKNCARFLRCMGFDIDDWSEEMRSEIQKW